MKAESKLMPELKKQSGLWADPLGIEEVNFSKQAADALSKVEWAKPLLTEAKISRALSCVPNDGRTMDALLEIKSALFEVRFAYAIHVANFAGQYEHKTGVGRSSVDFLICGKAGQRNWLIELTSLHESEAAKKSSWQKESFFGYVSYPKPGKNSTEIRDIIKVQQAILHKVASKEQEAIKFPMPTAENYHVIVVDVRAWNIGTADKWDFHNIVYGSQSLAQKKNGIFCQHWIGDDGKSELLRGVLDPSHPDQKAKHLRERVHAVAFISEKHYTKSEMNAQISIWPNPHLVAKEQFHIFRSLFPLSIAATSDLSDK